MANGNEFASHVDALCAAVQNLCSCVSKPSTTAADDEGRRHHVMVFKDRGRFFDEVRNAQINGFTGPHASDSRLAVFDDGDAVLVLARVRVKK